MRAIIIGCGRMGSAAAEDLAKKMSNIEVFVADKDADRAKETARKIGKSNVKWLQLDASNKSELVNALNEFDLALGFLPPKFGFSLIEACIEAEKNLVDVSYMPENPLVLHDRAVEAGVTIVPSCGLAPGISNILVGHAVAELDETHKVHIMVGGLPETLIPPLGYVITWSPESLIDEYTSKARIVRSGKIAEVEALDGLEEVEFPKIGKLEAFYTDGLRTLLYTIKDIEEMWEKTLRYPGHAEKIKLLRELGFFSDKEVIVEGHSVLPRKVTAKLLEEKLIKPDVKDVVVLRVEVIGLKNGERTRYLYDLVDYYDKKSGTTAMARTTAFTASIVANLILTKTIGLKGVVPPEKLGMDKETYQKIMKEWKNRGIEIIEKISVE
ncbi:MAG: saccharopine dehydrogenase family protein [Candidatus Bathyarchaeia archaeon]